MINFFLRLIVSCLSIWMVSASICYAQIIPAWVNSYGNSPSIAYRATGMKVDRAGSVYIAGYAEDTARKGFGIILKYSTDGILLWQDTLKMRCYPKIEIDNSGNAYVFSCSEAPLTDLDFLVAKYNSFGDTLWTATFSSPQSNGIDFTTNLTTDDSLNVYVVGVLAPDTINNPTGAFGIIKYNAAGKLQWAREYPTPYYQNGPYDVAADSFSNVYITGHLTDSLGLITVKYNAAGTQQWVRRYDGDIFGTGMFVEVFQDKYLYVGGVKSAGGWSDFLAIKYDLDGNEIWASTFDAASYFQEACIGGWDFLDDMKIDGKGSVYMAGAGIATTSCHNFLTVVFNSDGILQWARDYDGGNSWDEIRSIVLDNSGNVYVTGEVFDTAFASATSNVVKLITTIVYDSLGNSKNLLKYLQALQEDHVPVGTGLDSLNQFYVVGNTSTAGMQNILVVKYGIVSDVIETNPANENMVYIYPNPTNDKLWCVAGNGNSDKLKCAILSTDGRLFLQNMVTQPGFEIDVSALPTGIYFLQLSDAKRRVVKKFVKY